MKRRCALIYTIFFATALYALPTLNVFKVSGSGVDEKTVVHITDVLYGFLAETKDYTVVDCRSYASHEASAAPSSDFSFYGTILFEKDEFKVDLVLKNVATGSIRLLSKNFANSNLILLETKSLLQKLLDQSYDLSNTASLASVAPTVSDTLSGTWQGEDDVKSIKLLQNGRGVIIFKNGLSVSVDFVEKNGSITVVQKGNITERQFPHLSKELAQEALKKVKPITWVLSGNMSRLTGTRSESVVTVTDGKINSITTTSIDVAWVKVE